MSCDFQFICEDLHILDSSTLRRTESRLVELRGQLHGKSVAPSAWRLLGRASQALWQVRQELAGRIQA